MTPAAQLKTTLQSLHRKSYPAYKSLQGSYRFPHYILAIDHVQGDPFAAPSKLHVEVSGDVSSFPKFLYDTKAKRIALQDFLTRKMGFLIGRVSHRAAGSGKSGLISISRPGQEVLERSCMSIDPVSGTILARFEVGFPANGRSINAPELAKILFDFLPECVEKSLSFRNLNEKALNAVAKLCEDQEFIREELKKRKLAAFVADGSLLPRLSGVSDKPMEGGISFVSPDSLKITLDLPHKGKLCGMGIPEGITLIVGGGFHGKSTLLEALEMGVYNHIAGDGREFVITDNSGVKLRAEDSRSIAGTDISLFINHLPNGKDTKAFSTGDASGSTSQAANVVEGIESGSRLFLIDEDTSATNFMIRDELMQQVVSNEEEPITPFISRVRAFYENDHISSVLVAGSSGAYFHVADHIIQMKEYLPFDITEIAKIKAKDFPTLHSEGLPYALPVFTRRPKPHRDFSDPKRDLVKIKVMGTDGFLINKNTTDVRCLEQLADAEQVAGLAYLLAYAAKHFMDGKRTLTEIVDLLEKQIETKGLASLSTGSYLSDNLCRPRRQEIFAGFNRCRTLTF
ncbi:ATPase [Clostridia bacterium]|nr:ATPase [Clostridia bacterium]